MIRVNKIIGFLLLTFLFATPLQALDINGNGSMRGDAVVLYRFNSTNATVDANGVVIHDIADSKHGAPLDLKLFDGSSSNYKLTSEYFEFVQTNVLRSINSAQTKIIDKCKSSNEMSIELWIQNRTPAQRIVNNESDNNPPIKQSLRILSLGDTYFKEFSNFAVYQGYNDGEIYKSAIRTSENSAKNTNFSNVQGMLRNPFLSAREDVLPISSNLPQHLVITRSKGGVVNFYRSDEMYLDTLTQTVSQDFAGNLSAGWYSTGESVRYNTLDDNNINAVERALDMRLAFGNEASAPNDFSKAPAPESRTFNSRNYPWVGKIYLAAIYCRELTKDELLGARAPNSEGFEKIPLDLTVNVTPSLKKAQKLFQMLNGVATPIYNPRLKQMANLIDENRIFDAAGHAIEDGNGPDFNNPSDRTYYNPSFYNIVVRDFAAPMSTRDESINTGLNDFIVTLIGNVRDNLSAKELLSGNYIYMADPLKAAVPSNMERDIVRSNLHYSSLAAGGFNLAKVLKKVPQKLFNGTTLVDNPDPAGLITSRTFMEAHAIAGTNRRIIEYTFREFLCIPIEKWAGGTQAGDAKIGRDIDRIPGGSATKFVQNCRSCHSTMDPLRGAFAYFTFSNNYTKNTLVVPRSSNFADDEDMNHIVLTGLRTADPGTGRLPGGNSHVNYVVKKMNHNDHVFDGGYVTYDNSFINESIDKESNKYFGWRGNLSGKGAHDFGMMISQSEGFSRCMTKRVFKTLCKRDAQASEDGMIQSTAKEFEAQGYKLKFLFKKVAGFPQCLGS